MLVRTRTIHKIYTGQMQRLLIAAHTWGPLASFDYEEGADIGYIKNPET